MSKTFEQSTNDEQSFKNHLGNVIAKLQQIDGKEDAYGAVICFVDKKQESFTIHGVNLLPEEVKAVFVLATADFQTELVDRIKAQFEKELTNPNQH
jgi:hypothetical protein